MVDQPSFLSGKLLLAMPGMADPRFERAVIAMCVHDENGAVGVGIGHKRAGISFRGLLRQLDIEPGEAPDCAVLHGGPVEPGRGFVLHSSDWGGHDTLDVAGRWALSGTLDVLRAIAAGNGPSRWLVALGYAGWAPGQLDAEMTRHGWLNVADSPEMLFDTPVERRWTRGFAAAGVDPRLLSSESGHS